MGPPRWASPPSFSFDKSILEWLIDKAPDDREAQRLRRVSQEHASGFITAVPSEEDGNDTVLRPRNFRISVAYRLGIPVLNDNIPCPLCKQTIDIHGDHAMCCTRSGDRIVRHNSIRNFVDRIASDGMLAPVMEKQGILGPTSGRRPGDVTIPIWERGKGLAIDVAVTSPLTPSHVRLCSPCDDYAAAQKHRKYDASFLGQPYLFAALVLETTGAINVEGVNVLRMLFRFAAKRLGREFSSFCGRPGAFLEPPAIRCHRRSCPGSTVRPQWRPASVRACLSRPPWPSRLVVSSSPPRSPRSQLCAIRPSRSVRRPQ